MNLINFCFGKIINLKYLFSLIIKIPRWKSNTENWSTLLVESLLPSRCIQFNIQKNKNQNNTINGVLFLILLPKHSASKFIDDWAFSFCYKWSKKHFSCHA